MIYLILCSSIFLNIYSFLAIPDTPLLFFSTLFLYIYRRYLKNDNIYNVIFLAFIASLLLYSKYHGILIIGFTVCSNPKLFYRKSFYIAFALATLFYLPHIIWQIQNNYPTLKFHLFDKGSNFKLQNVISYLSEQLGVTGPIFLLLFSIIYKCKTSFQKTLKFNVIGIFTFFLFSSFKENVNLHWTAVAWPPMLCLAYLYIRDLNLKRQILIKKILVFNLIIVVFLRINFMFNWFSIPHFNDKNPKLMTKVLKTYTKNNPIVFKDMYIEPSYFAFYEHNKCFAVNDIGYKKTQFNYLFELENEFQNKTISLISNDSINSTSQFIEILKGKNYYITEIPHFVSFITTIRIEAMEFKKLKSGLPCNIPFLIHDNLKINPKESLNNRNVDLMLNFENKETKNRFTYKFNGLLNFSESNILYFNITAPLIKGNYKCIFSIIYKNQNFIGFNSDIYHVKII